MRPLPITCLMVAVAAVTVAPVLLIAQDSAQEAKKRDRASCAQDHTTRAIQRRSARQTLRSSHFLSRHETSPTVRRFWHREYLRRARAYRTVPPISCRYLK